MDFKKQVLGHYNFRNLSSYVESHGLTLQVKPIFFLHLFKNNYHAVLKTNVNTETSNQKDTEIDHVVKKIKKEPEDAQEIKNQSSKLTMANKIGNEKIMTDSSSSSSSESESEDEKNKLPGQNVGYESLRQKNKLLNSVPNTLPKSQNKYKRDSSSSSVSSSSSTASFKKAKKLDKKFNRRIQELKNESNSNSLKISQNTEPLLPTPNKTPSINANLASDQFNKKNNSTNNKIDDILLKDENTKKPEEDVAVFSNQSQKYDRFVRKYLNLINFSSKKIYHCCRQMIKTTKVIQIVIIQKIEMIRTHLTTININIQVSFLLKKINQKIFS